MMNLMIIIGCKDWKKDAVGLLYVYFYKSAATGELYYNISLMP